MITKFPSTISWEKFFTVIFSFLIPSYPVILSLCTDTHFHTSTRLPALPAPSGPAEVEEVSGRRRDRRVGWFCVTEATADSLDCHREFWNELGGVGQQAPLVNTRRTERPRPPLEEYVDNPTPCVGTSVEQTESPVWSPFDIPGKYTSLLPEFRVLYELLGILSF
jgi:hypothetical protein